jgi:hypothetical protein
MPFEILGAAVAAASGLVGVTVGAYFTALNQKRERQQRRISEQLAEFYGPMLALRAQVLSRSELSLRISERAGSAWQSMIRHAYESKDELRAIDLVEELTKGRFPDFEKLTRYGNRQLAEDIIPAYRKMVALFTLKMHLAEPSTISHFPALFEFVEIWNRWLDGSLPVEVLGQLNHSEETLFPFYGDLADNFARMQQMMRERRLWRRPPPPKVQGPALAVSPFAAPGSGAETRQPSN